MKMPGVVGVLTGQQIVDDKIGNLICGWVIPSKDGTPMKMGAWPAMAPATVRYVGDAVAVVIAETKDQARDAAEAVEVDYEELPAAVDIRAAIKTGRAADSPGSAGQQSIYDWDDRRRSRDRRRVQGRGQCRRRSTSSTTGWCRTRWSRARRSANTNGPKSTTRSGPPSQNPHVARLRACRAFSASRRSTSCG